MIESAPRSTSSSDLSDESLVLRAQNGSLEAFEAIVARFEGRLFNFIARRLGSGHRQTDAEDLTQETFLRGWKSVNEYRPQHRFSTWLFTIASRLVVDHQRHRRVHLAAADTLWAAANSRSQPSDRTDHDVDRDAGRRLWRNAAHILTTEQHAAVWLRYAEDLSPAEVARVLNKNEVAVRVMLFRARQALATHLPENEAAGSAACRTSRPGPSSVASTATGDIA